MNMKQFGLLALGAAFASGLATQSYAAKYIMKVRGDAFYSYAFSTSSQKAFSILDTHEAGHLMKIEIDDAKNISVLKDLFARPEVQYIVRDFKLKAFSTPIDSNALRTQWALPKIQADKAWKQAGNKGNRKVTVAVIDTGMDYNHESLKLNAVAGYNFKDDNADPMDITGTQNPGHGTHCSGIVGATGLVDNGTSGISPEVSIMPLRFLGADGSGDLMAGIKAIDYAIEKKVDVISASWGATVSASEAQPLIDAVKRASDAGVVMVSAAANDGSNNDTTEVYPANATFDNTITVAASGSNDEKPSWSNYGTAKVHLASPGLDIMSTLPRNTYGNLSGTSMATPLVSGLVALLKAQDSTLTGSQVRALLQTTGAKVNIQTACNCRIDAAAAMDVVLNKTPYIYPAAGTLKIGESQKVQMANAKGTVSFTSSNPAIATVDADGNIKAVAKGETTISSSDSKGLKAISLAFHVTDGTDNGGGGGGGGSCPIGDAAACDAICKLIPSLPFCKH